MNSFRINWLLTPSLVLIFVACGRPAEKEVATSVNRADLSPLFADALASLAKSEEAAAKVISDRVFIGDHEVALRAQVENEGLSEGKYYFAVAVQVAIDGEHQPFTAGSVGLGATKREAVDTAIYEWTQLVGPALIGALGVAENEDPAISWGRFSIHPGKAAFRVEAEAVTWSMAHHRKLLDRLRAIISELPSGPGEFHSISVMAVIESGVARSGECRINGEISSKALTAIRFFDWPAAEEGYLFKVFYILRQLNS